MIFATTPFFFLVLLSALSTTTTITTVSAFGITGTTESSSPPFAVVGGGRRRSSSSSALFAASKLKPGDPIPKPKRKGYIPKWKKKKTLADEMGVAGATGNFEQVGIKGDIPVVFKQGNETKKTMASVGQPLREVAIQAGQFIKYGCGKGECGTCEALVNGKWIRPCSVSIPPECQPGQDYVISVKEVKNKAPSSGKFYSFRSIVIGFWNNLVGMVGFVKYRRNAKRNWEERKEYEDLIKRKTLEKKLARERQQQQQ